MNLISSLFGQQIGRLTVLARLENAGRQTRWLCWCECGMEKVASGGDLRSGRVQSCGCLPANQNIDRMESA